MRNKNTDLSQIARSRRDIFWVALLALLTLTGFYSGGGAGEESSAAHDGPSMTAAAAGGSIDVEYLNGESFKDLGGDEKFVYPAKFVCGEAVEDDWLVPATYKTVINVLNLSRFSVNFQWSFSTFDASNSIDGATAQLGNRSSLVMDCDFILRNLAAQNVDVTGLTEGFVYIEDLIPTKAIRVAVVYSMLHKQRHDRPDLVPVRKDPRFCTLDENGRLLVTIANIGEIPAEVSTTHVTFDSRQPVALATPTLDPGEEVKLQPVEIQRDGEGPVVITINADAESVVLESNEANNRAIGSCVFID